MSKVHPATATTESAIVLKAQEGQTGPLLEAEDSDGVRTPVVGADGAVVGGEGGSFAPSISISTSTPVNPQPTFFTVEITDVSTSGTFKVEWWGERTAALDFDISGDDLLVALEAVSTIGVGNVLLYDSGETLQDNGGLGFALIGDLMGESDVPTIEEDTTDGGVVMDATPGSSSVPSAPSVGDFYVQDVSGSRFTYLFIQITPDNLQWVPLFTRDGQVPAVGTLIWLNDVAVAGNFSTAGFPPTPTDVDFDGVMMDPGEAESIPDDGNWHPLTPGNFSRGLEEYLDEDHPTRFVPFHTGRSMYEVTGAFAIAAGTGEVYIGVSKNDSGVQAQKTVSLIADEQVWDYIVLKDNALTGSDHFTLVVKNESGGSLSCSLGYSTIERRGMVAT